jgi:anthranilate synthase component 2
MRILILDNYDSFTYNLVHYINELVDAEVDVARNDKISIEEIDKYSHILLSPGPGIPDEAGILKEVIKTYAPTKSIFGVCLGMQAIGEVFGGQLINLDKVYHGVAMPVNIINKDEIIFQAIPDRIQVGRYHSWVIQSNNLPDELIITATDDEGRLMALRHKEYDVRGVQFHPESILTDYGMKMLENWLFPPDISMRSKAFI